jgi:hypothetical protein
MTYDIAAERRRLDQIEDTRRQFLAATGHPDPFAERVRGAIFAMVGPRLALDAQMPDLNEALQGVDRGNFRSRRRMIGDRIRKAMRGRLGRDADLDDLDELLAALEREEEGEDGRRARDDEPVNRPGFEPATDPAEDPFREAHDFLDEELEEMRGSIGEDAYRRLRAAFDRRHRDAEDRRQGRDTPFHRFDRRRAEDDPSFAGAPRTGGGMYPMENANIDRPGFPPATDPAAKDRRPGFRKFGQDSAPRSFERRFAFTGNAAVGHPTMPGIKVGTF